MMQYHSSFQLFLNASNVRELRLICGNVITKCPSCFYTIFLFSLRNMHTNKRDLIQLNCLFYVLSVLLTISNVSLFVFICRHVLLISAVVLISVTFCTLAKLSNVIYAWLVCIHIHFFLKLEIRNFSLSSWNWDSRQSWPLSRFDLFFFPVKLDLFVKTQNMKHVGMFGHWIVLNRIMQ